MSVQKLTTKNPAYHCWYSMVGRCTKPSFSHYENYGGAGITVFDAWVGFPDGFNRFLSHIGERPSSGHQIDRINNSRGYEPGNVRWATTREQARNRGQNLFLVFNGKRMCAADWATELGISRQSLQKRLREWPLERALTETRRKYTAGRAALKEEERT